MPPLPADGSVPDARLIAALRQQVAELQSRLRASEARSAMWEECMQQLCHCVLLSPDMNDMYKDYCSELLRDVRSALRRARRVVARGPAVAHAASPAHAASRPLPL